MTEMKGKSETVNINVQIAERFYPLKVVKGDEEKVQAAVKLVNDQIKRYQVQYDGKDKQDYMAMCLLELAVERAGLKDMQQQDNRQLEEKLLELETILSDTSK